MTEHKVHVHIENPLATPGFREIVYTNHSLQAARDFRDAARSAQMGTDSGASFVESTFKLTGWTIEGVEFRDPEVIAAREERLRRETEERETRGRETPDLDPAKVPYNGSVQFTPANMPKRTDPAGPPARGRLAIATPTGIIVGSPIPWDDMLNEIDEILDNACGPNADRAFYNITLGPHEFQWIRYSDIVSVGPARHGQKN